MGRIGCLPLLLIVGWLPAAPAVAQPATLFSEPGRLRQIGTAHHTLYTDLEGDDAREAVLRLATLTDEYIGRTRGFSRRLTKQLPLYLFRHESDYVDAGGLAETSGFFDGTRLMIVAGKQAGPATWHTLQHEGFHQFAAAVINPDLPIWVNEGLAEYFGEAVFTGDDYLTGGIPEWRMERVRDALKEGTFIPLQTILTMTPAEWNSDIQVVRYDQAWAMVQFLAHADNARYRGRLAAYIDDVARGRESEAAWRRQFGDDDAAVARRFTDYWMNLPAQPTSMLYATAAGRTMTLFLAHAQAAGHTPESLESLAASLLAGRVSLPGNLWLPDALLVSAMSDGARYGTWSIVKDPAGALTVVGKLNGGAVLTGRYSLRGNVIDGVRTDLDETAVQLALARDAVNNGRRQDAIAMYQKILARSPRSPAAQDARTELQALVRPPGSSPAGSKP